MADLSGYSDAELEKLAKTRTMSDAELERIAHPPPPSWGQVKERIGPAALKGLGEAGDWLADLPNNPLGPRIIRGAKAVGGALYDATKDELGSDLQYVRNLSPQQFRGSAPAMAGGEPEHHPLLSLTQGDTAPYQAAAKVDPLLGLTQGNVDPLKKWAQKGTFTGPLVGETGPLRTALATAPLGVAADIISTVGPTRPGRMALEAGAAATAAAARAPGAVVRSGRRALTRMATQEPLHLEDAQLVRDYERMGGFARPGQYAPSNFMRVGDSMIADSSWPRSAGFQRDSQHAIHPAQQSDQHNRLLSNTFGEDETRITEGVLNRAGNRIGRVYDEVLPRNHIMQSDPLVARLDAVGDRVTAAGRAVKPTDARRIRGVIQDLRTQLGGGGITGQQYQLYRQRGGLLDELAASDSPVLQASGRDLRRALDDAFADQAQGNDGQLLRQARDQYRAMETLRPLAMKAPGGKISPALVLQRVIDEYGSPEEAGRLGTLARAGKAFLGNVGTSNTTERGIWAKILHEPLKLSTASDVANRIGSFPANLTAARVTNRLINAPDARRRLLAHALNAETAASIPPGPNAHVLAWALRQQGRP